MKRIFSFLLLSFCITCINAQTGNRDSIIKLLQKDKEDTSRVLHLADLSFEYIESKPDTMMILALQALELSQRIGFLKGEAISLNRVGNAYGSFYNYTKGMETYLKALQINEKIKNIDGKQRNLNNIGNIYRNQEDYRTALSYYFQAKALAEQIKNNIMLSVTLDNIAQTYNNLEVFDSASLYAEQAYSLASRINYFRIMGSTMVAMGRTFFETGRNNSALEHYRLSIPFSIKAKNDLKLGEAYLQLARVFEKTGQKDSVLFYAKSSLTLTRERRFTKDVRDAARFLSYYYRKVNADSAFFYQDISRAANDSIFSQQKQRQFQSLAFDEKIRQQELAAADLKEKKKRNNNLQYAAIALGLLTFIILFLLLSHSIIANQKLIRFLGVIALLIVFEFINLFIHPYLSHATNDSPLIMLLVMVCIAALLVPLHHRMEKRISHRLVEKNKKIRLEAAKKTIAKLEPASAKASADKGEQTN